MSLTLGDPLEPATPLEIPIPPEPSNPPPDTDPGDWRPRDGSR